MMRPPASRDRKRDALKAVAPNWRRAIALYQEHKPWGRRPKALMVLLLVRQESIHCRRCGDSALDAGTVLDERCPVCKGYDTVWPNEFPDTEGVAPSQGGGGDPLSGRDFCADLDCWFNAFAYQRFKIHNGQGLLELRYIEGVSTRGLARRLGYRGRSTMGRLFDEAGEEWDREPEEAPPCPLADWRGGSNAPVG